MSRQLTDNRHRYNVLVRELRCRYPYEAELHIKAIRHLMEELDYLRMGDIRTQNKYIRWLLDPCIMGEAVMERVGRDFIRLLPISQSTLESNEIMELVRV